MSTLVAQKKFLPFDRTESAKIARHIHDRVYAPRHRAAAPVRSRLQ